MNRNEEDNELKRNRKTNKQEWRKNSRRRDGETRRKEGEEE
jgi:hypothetical protein